MKRIVINGTIGLVFMFMAIMACAPDANLKPSQVTQPAQTPTNVVAPAATVAPSADLAGLRAEIVELKQQMEVQNTTITKLTETLNQTTIAIQKSIQNTNDTMTKIGGNVASLTQQNFRFESWLAESTGGHILHGLGVAPYVRSDSGNDPDSQSGTPERGVAGVRHRVRDAGSGVPGGARARGGRPVPDPQRSDTAPIKKGGEIHMGMVLFIVILNVFFYLLGLATQPLVSELNASLGAKIAADEAGLIHYILFAVSWVLSLFSGKKKAANAPATPPVPKAGV